MLKNITLDLNLEAFRTQRIRNVLFGRHMIENVLWIVTWNTMKLEKKRKLSKLGPKMSAQIYLLLCFSNKAFTQLWEVRSLIRTLSLHPFLQVTLWNSHSSLRC